MKEKKISRDESQQRLIFSGDIFFLFDSVDGSWLESIRGYWFKLLNDLNRDNSLFFSSSPFLSLSCFFFSFTLFAKSWWTGLTGSNSSLAGCIYESRPAWLLPACGNLSILLCAVFFLFFLHQAHGLIQVNVRRKTEWTSYLFLFPYFFFLFVRHGRKNVPSFFVLLLLLLEMDLKKSRALVRRPVIWMAAH